LSKHLEDPDWAVIDCRFSLADTKKGRQDYLLAHILGAVYSHLDEDLCSPVIPGKTGRHPLPDVDQLVKKFARWGIDSSVQVVVYDDWTVAPGAIAGRLWWSLRWLGHQAVAVLDGGYNLWLSEGRATRSGREYRIPRKFAPSFRPELLVTFEGVDRVRLDPAYRVLDSRATERYRGDVEPIDPVAGHIPGAISAPYAQNVSSEGIFLPPDELNTRYRSLVGDTPAENTIFYCGSGVTALHNVLAYAHAGLGDARLYLGSWSEWITDRNRPVATGGEE
jgi:thiosulfate/3-mercaptopyruvate sulfurtransferase